MDPEREKIIERSKKECAFRDPMEMVNRVTSGDLAETFEKQGFDLWEKRRKKIDKWNNENRELCRQLNREYYQTPKGQIAAKRRNSTRVKRYREEAENLSDQDLEDIKQFYCECPEDHVVDHIIPMSREGRHHVSNLQYLPKLINLKKGDKLPEELKDCDWYKPYLSK
jgi:5-methylcytosine-specific restriction endonuclease McrA